MGNTFYFQWEVDLMEAIQSAMGDFAVKIASFITLFGEEYILVAIAGFLYWGLNKNVGKRLCINLLLAVNVAPMIKNIFFRRRPYFDNPSIKCLKPVDADYDIYDIDGQGYSFPSGHSFCASSAFPSIAYYYRKKWLIAIGIVMPILVAISRFALGVHYPTDTIVGLIFGVVVTFVTPKLYDKYLDSPAFLLILLLLCTPGLFYCHTTDYYSGFGLMLGASFAFIFESKYVKFTNSDKLGIMIIRTLGGLAIFLALAQLPKLFIPANYFTRVLRYSVGSFVSMGLYPMLFDRKRKEN